MVPPPSRFCVPSNEIDKAIDRLIKAASPYPDDNLAKAIDAVRVIIRKQELYINEMVAVIKETER